MALVCHIFLLHIILLVSYNNTGNVIIRDTFIGPRKKLTL